MNRFVMTDDALWIEPRTAAFNPDQERDEHGRWTDGDVGFPADNVPRTFDEADDESSEWQTIFSHDQFLDNKDAAVTHGFEKDVRKQLDALQYYRGDGYRVLNRALNRDPEILDRAYDNMYRRGGDIENDPDEDEDGDTARSKISDQAFWLSDLIGEAPRLKEPVTVYRATKPDPKLDNLKAGEYVTLNGFQSATFDPAVTSKYATEGGHTLEIRADQGLALGPAHSIEGEMEFIMDHGDSYKVVGTKTVPMMRYNVEKGERELQPTKILQLVQSSVLRRKK